MKWLKRRMHRDQSAVRGNSKQVEEEKGDGEEEACTQTDRKKEREKVAVESNNA